MTLENLLDGDGGNAVVRAKHGYVLYNRHDRYIGRSIEQYGEYSELEVALLATICRRGDVDVGANIGTHTLALARLVGLTGRVLAFEPQRVVFQTLCANVALNSLTNVECFQIGLGSAAGRGYIKDVDYSTEGNFGALMVRSDSAGDDSGDAEPVAVQIASLDEFLGVPHLRLLKIDVEGMEREVVRGASGTLDQHRPALYVENAVPERSKALIEEISRHEYRLY